MAASVQVYIKNAGDFAAMNEVYRTFWKADPPARTTIVADFVVPGALLEISAVAIPNGGERQVIHPPSWMKSPNPYSYGIKSGNTLFLAGLVARNGKDNSRRRGRRWRVQTKAVLDNGAEILKAAGMSFERRRQLAGVHHRRHEVPGDERRLPHVLHQGPAGPRHRGGAAHGHRQSWSRSR